MKELEKIIIEVSSVLKTFSKTMLIFQYFCAEMFLKYRGSVLYESFLTSVSQVFWEPSFYDVINNIKKASVKSWEILLYFSAFYTDFCKHHKLVIITVLIQKNSSK